MFDATFATAQLLKKIVTALTDVLKDVSFECSENSMVVMGMDASHVALVNLCIKAETDGQPFTAYRCDKPKTLSFKVETLAKVLKTVGNDDTIQIIVEEDSNTAKFVVVSKELKRESTYNINLIELESEHLGVPESNYESEVQMPSGEFAKLMRDLSIHGESLQLNLDKDALRLSVKGDEAAVNVQVNERMSKKERETQDKIADLEDKLKQEEETPAVQDEKEDVDMGEEGESLEAIKKEKADKKVTKAKKAQDQEEKEGEDENMSRIAFTVTQPISAVYSLRYMNMFAKAAPLGNYVKLSISDEQPIIVMFPLEDEKRGHLSFYLAPKIDE